MIRIVIPAVIAIAGAYLAPQYDGEATYAQAEAGSSAVSFGPPTGVCGPFVRSEYFDGHRADLQTPECYRRSDRTPQYEYHNVRETKNIYENGSVWKCVAAQNTEEPCHSYLESSCPSSTCVASETPVD
ncbi:hypothetical protein EON81_24565 [bacterium]|nr:MAG: hypothetical protein EON81_24565 [bacterium]